jgi:endoplasmic reticulum-Golgi intermediate compartment protein 3
MNTDCMQDISPMKVINREARTKSFSGFLVGVCAVIGGTLTVAAAIDRAFYEGGQRIRKMHSN